MSTAAGRISVNDSERQSFFASLSGLVETQEELISRHPPETSALYAGGVAGMISHLRENPPPISGEHEFQIVLRYLLSLSFIGAWADIHQPDFDRNKAATAAMIPLSCMSDEFRSNAIEIYLYMQKTWKKGFSRSAKKWWQFWK
jgi:hypothetical protein